MQKVLYSYLLDREKNLERALIVGGYPAFLHKTIASAKRARKEDCFDGEHKAGKIVKITLEIVPEE